MQICFEDIILRDMVASDIEDEIRWHTAETAWQDWDAPWEWEAGEPFDAEEYRRREWEKLARPKDAHRIRYQFEIEAASRHVGSVNAYHIDSDYNWSAEPGRLAIGIDICESRDWGRGIGGRVFAAFAAYLFSQGYEELYTQTWSGNLRMIRMAERVGFKLCRRDIGMRQVRGRAYDRVTMRVGRPQA